MGKRWTEDEILIVKNNYATKTKEELLVLLPNRSTSSINEIAFRNNFRKLKSDSLHNLSVLLEDVPESYYWIGFIMADGCFTGKTLNESYE